MPFLSTAGAQIFYHKTSGPPSSTITLLLIHGLGSSSAYYFPIIPVLAQHHTVIAFDSYGSGLSKLQASRSEPNSISGIARDARDVLDECHVTGKLIVVGHSMGGIVASVLATLDRRVEGVVLIGPVHPSEALAGVFKARIEVVERDNNLLTFADTVPQAATGSLSTPTHHAFIRALILGTAPKGYASLCNAIATAETPKYSEIRVPLMILCGEDDKTAPRSGCEQILASYGTRAEWKWIVDLPGVGHWHVIEDSGKVAKHIGEFVNSTAMSGYEYMKARTFLA